jgi:hypothetical protein
MAVARLRRLELQAGLLERVGERFRNAATTPGLLPSMTMVCSSCAVVNSGTGQRRWHKFAMPGPLDAYECSARAKKLRRLALTANQDMAERLLREAAEYEAKAIEMDEGSKAGRPPQMPPPRPPGN